MNQDIVNFSRFIDYFEYSDNILEIVDEYLKRIFDADMICFHETYINKGYHGLYLPVSVEGKNIGYYEVVRAKKKLSNIEFNEVFSLVMQFFTKLNAFLETSINEHRNLVYGMNYLRAYENNLDINSIMKLNCLLISVYDYETIVNIYGLEAANYMMKITVNMIKSVFNLPSDVIFKYAKNQIIVFITNKTDMSIQTRIGQLGSMLNSNEINVNYGLSSSSENFDLKKLISLAENNIYSLNDNFGRRY